MQKVICDSFTILNPRQAVFELPFDKNPQLLDDEVRTHFLNSLIPTYPDIKSITSVCDANKMTLVIMGNINMEHAVAFAEQV